MATFVQQVVKVELSAYDRELLKAMIRALGGSLPDDPNDVSFGKRLVEDLPRIEGEGDWTLFDDEHEGDDVD